MQLLRAKVERVCEWGLIKIGESQLCRRSSSSASGCGRMSTDSPVRRSKSSQVSLLRLAVDDIRIFRIDRTVMAIAANGDSPVGIADARVRPRSGRAVLRIVVLRSTDHVIKRFVVVDINLVELSQRQVRRRTDRSCRDPRNDTVRHRIRPEEIGVGRMERDRVVVDMFVGACDALEGRSAVVRCGRAEHWRDRRRRNDAGRQ